MIATDAIPPTEPRPRLTMLPLPTRAAVERAAISAAEALHLYGVTLGAPGRPSLIAWAAGVRLRGDEARGELQILGAMLNDAGDGEGAGRAWSIAGQMRLDVVALVDLGAYESWCREVAAAADDEARATEPGVVAP